MSSEKSDALIVRVIDFSETSCVVTCFTREFGKITALAKGARRPKGPFEGAIDLLAICRIVFLHKSSEALDLLTEAKLERRFRGAATGLTCVYAGYYIAELLRELTDEGDPHPELYEAAVASLSALQEGFDWPSVVLHFELSALRMLGHYPSLFTCVQCGEGVQRGGRLSISPSAGGVLCANCRGGHKGVISVTTETIEVLERFSQPVNLAEMDLPAQYRGEIRGLMNDYVANLLGRRPRMYEYVGL